MATLAPLLLHGLLSLSLALGAHSMPGDHGNLTRESFPAGFVFGTASSAYQVEGNTLKYGRGPCIWDTFLKYPGEMDESTVHNHHCISWDFFHLAVPHVASLIHGCAGTTPDNATANVTVDEYNRYMVSPMPDLGASVSE